MARRTALALTLVSWLGWSAWELARPATNPFMDLSGGVFTDHFSHLNAGRVFMRHGADVWRKPLAEMMPRPTPQQWRALPDELKRRPDCVFLEPSWKKPVLQSWPHVVRFYPPGDMVLTAPVALLYHFTGLSFTDANRLLLLIFLCAAHAGLFVLLEGILTMPDGGRFAGLLAASLGVNCTLRWTLEGFYDASILLPLLLCWRWLGERRGLAAGVAFCAAAFLHFRAYYYAPWALWAGWLVVRERGWRWWRPRDVAAAAAAAAMGAASLYSFALALRGLLAFGEQTSPLLIARGHFDAAALSVGAALAALAAAAFLVARSFPDVVLLGWVALVLTAVRQTYAWYVVAAVPWLCAPPRVEPRKAALVFDARVLLFLFLALHVHADGQYAAEAALPLWVPRLLR